MQLRFDQPVLLVLLPVCLGVVYALWRSSRVYLPAFRRYAALGLRCLGVTLLVLVLAGPQMTLNANDLAVAVLMDRSDSISPQQRAQEEAWLASALAQKRSADRLGVITFAGDATLQRPLSTDSSFPLLASDSTLHGSQTNVAQAIRMGLGILPPDAARRIVLLSDGNENVEQEASAAALASAAGVQIDVLPLQQDSGPQALVDALDAPTRLHDGDRFTVTAQVRATAAMSATLYLLVDGELFAQQDVDFQAGANRFIIPAGPLHVGDHVLRLQLDAPMDPRAENKTGAAYVVVDGPPRVLVLEGSPGQGSYLADALRATGLQVDVSNPASAPSSRDELNSYASVVLANVPASALGPGQLDAFKTYVQTHGGGLVVAGGDQAFGPGGYARTPLEDLLPVQMDLRGTSVSASTVLVLAIDTSGSMSSDVGGTSIMELAKSAAVAAAELLGPADQIGVIAFADQSQWAIQPTSAANLGAIDDAVSQMQPNGGDDTIGGVLQLAASGMQGITAKSRHVIILTDGETPGGDYAAQLAQLNAAGITVSTIGIGSQSDTQLLQQVAALGNGSYYDGSDPFNLPQLVVKETQQLQRAAIVEKDVQPVPLNSSPILGGLDPSQMPTLRGYVATSPKPQGTVVLASEQGDPLLAEWQYGLGRVVAWTSDVTNRWSSRWLEWPEFASFWTQLVKRTIRPAEDPERSVSVSVYGGQARVTLDARAGVETGDQQYVNFLPTSATLVDPGGAQQQASMPQVAPGEYETNVPVSSDGVYTLQVSETNPDGSIATQSSGFVVPYSPEYKDLGTNTGLLTALAQQTGGRAVQAADEVFAHDMTAASTERPVWPLLLTALAVVLVADIGVRRLRLSGLEVRRLVHRPARVAASVAPARPLSEAMRLRPGVSTTMPATRELAAVAPRVSRSEQLLAAKRRAAHR